MEIPEWSDLRIVLEVQRAGSIRGAGKRLGVNHATISRHITRIQEALGARLFERDGRGIRTTLAGEQLVEAARRIETEVLGVTRRLAARDERLEGKVRVTMTSGHFPLLVPHLPAFAERYPNILLEFNLEFGLSNLHRSESDIAVRITDSPGDTLIGRRVRDFDLGAYGHEEVLDKLEPCPLDAYPWMAWPDHVFKNGSWLRRNVPNAHHRVHVNSATAMIDLLLLRLGVAFVPCQLAETKSDLRHIAHELPQMRTAAWVLTHEDLRDVPRIKAVRDWLCEVLQ